MKRFKTVRKTDRRLRAETSEAKERQIDRARQEKIG